MVGRCFDPDHFQAGPSHEILPHLPMRRSLRVISGPLADEVFTIGGHTVIGRGGDADIQVLDKGMSRRHSCLVENDDGIFMLMDLSSQNGTFIGDERVTHRALHPGDSFRIGGSTFRYEGFAPTEQGSEGGDPELLEASINLLSGPAEDATSVVSGNQLSATMCGDPVHGLAQSKGWAHCPACGAKI